MQNEVSLNFFFIFIIFTGVQPRSPVRPVQSHEETSRDRSLLQHAQEGRKVGAGHGNKKKLGLEDSGQNQRGPCGSCWGGFWRFDRKNLQVFLTYKLLKN